MVLLREIFEKKSAKEYFHEEHNLLEKGEDDAVSLTKYLVKRSRSFPSCLNKKGHDRWFKHENSKKFYAIDEFLDDTDVDFFNKTNK